MDPPRTITVQELLTLRPGSTQREKDSPRWAQRCRCSMRKSRPPLWCLAAALCSGLLGYLAASQHQAQALPGRASLPRSPLKVASHAFPQGGGARVASPWMPHACSWAAGAEGAIRCTGAEDSRFAPLRAACRKCNPLHRGRRSSLRVPSGCVREGKFAAQGRRILAPGPCGGKSRSGITHAVIPCKCIMRGCAWSI